MRDLLGWNISLGHWGGVHVRVHVFFLLFALLVMHQAVVGSEGPRDSLVAYSAAGLLILFLSVLAHEFGHCVAAWQVGGMADQVMLWPFGGLTHVNITQDPAQERVTAIAGPLVNLGICLLAAPILLFAGAHQIGERANLFAPPLLETLTAIGAVRLVFWTNLLLVFVNLLPALPLDGARFLYAVLWPRTGFRQAFVLVARAAKVTAAFLCVGAVLLYRTQYEFASLPLALLAIYLYFNARIDRQHDFEADDSSFGYDFSQGYTSLEKAARPSARSSGLMTQMRQWLENRRIARQSRQRELEEDEERRVDDVLARLHEAGPGALSSEDKALLERVSARYRGRQSH